MTELLKFEAQISKRFPELVINEQEAILHILKHLEEDAKHYLPLLTLASDHCQFGCDASRFAVITMNSCGFGIQKEHQASFANAFGDPKSKGKDGGKGGGKDGNPRKTKGKEGRDCWAPKKQAAAVQQGADPAANASSSNQAPNPPNQPSAAAKATAAAANRPTTKGDVGGNGNQKGLHALLESSHFAMRMIAANFSQRDDEKIFWLLDSGGSFHVVCRDTFESGHVKILSCLPDCHRRHGRGGK